MWEPGKRDNCPENPWVAPKPFMRAVRRRVPLRVTIDRTHPTEENIEGDLLAFGSLISFVVTSNVCNSCQW